MGWNTVTIKKKSKLFANLSNESRFYFVHSYHLECKDKNDIITTSSHGYEFVSAVQKSNIYGVQFHPEKSHKFGMQLYSNFLKI